MKSLETEARGSPFFKPKEILVSQSTVGIDISESIPLTPLLSRMVGGGIDYVAWDFAGQLEYSTFHPVSSSPLHITFNQFSLLPVCFVLPTPISSIL